MVVNMLLFVRWHSSKSIILRVLMGLCMPSKLTSGKSAATKRRFCCGSFKRHRLHFNPDQTGKIFTMSARVVVSAIGLIRRFVGLWRIWLSLAIAIFIYRPLYFWLISWADPSVPNLICAVLVGAVSFGLFVVVLTVLYEIRAAQEFSAKHRRHRLVEE